MHLALSCTLSVPNLIDSLVSLGGGSCPYPHFLDEEIGLERSSCLLKSGRTKSQTQVCNSKACAPNFYGFPGCLQLRPAILYHQHLDRSHLPGCC